MTAPRAKRKPSKGKALAARERIDAALEEVIAAVADIDTATPEDITEALAVYGLLQDALNCIRDAQAVLGAHLVGVMPNRYESIPVPGGGIFKVAGGKERKSYDQDRLISTAAEKIASQLDIAGIITSDGEGLHGTEVIGHFAAEVAALAGATAPSFSNWRSGVAKRYGIRLNDFATLEDSPITTRIEGRSRTA